MDLAPMSEESYDLLLRHYGETDLRLNVSGLHIYQIILDLADDGKLTYNVGGGNAEQEPSGLPVEFLRYRDQADIHHLTITFPASDETFYCPIKNLSAKQFKRHRIFKEPLSA
jgi:hypothetical protein